MIGDVELADTGVPERIADGTRLGPRPPEPRRAVARTDGQAWGSEPSIPGSVGACAGSAGTVAAHRACSRWAHPRETKPVRSPRRASGSCHAIHRCPADTTTTAAAKDVVDERGARADVVGEQREVVQHQPGREQDDHGAEHERGVQLLAGVELARRERPAATVARAQPAPVPGQEPVEPAHVGAEGP